MESSRKDYVDERYVVACPWGRERQDVVAGPCLPKKKLGLVIPIDFRQD